MINIDLKKIHYLAKIEMKNDINIGKIIEFISEIDNIQPIAKYSFRHPWIKKIIMDKIIEEDISNNLDKTANYKDYFIVPKIL
ncbi:hypothetical protein AB836_00335 [Rickettsiales bacterium (ex Bugula neritina AB1)]|nr:hypothetical protein AB836_00335 [Rickettsiales bacterium (ex Bugula neritina AB1)]